MQRYTKSFLVTISFAIVALLVAATLIFPLTARAETTDEVPSWWSPPSAVHPDSGLYSDNPYIPIHSDDSSLPTFYLSCSDSEYLGNYFVDVVQLIRGYVSYGFDAPINFLVSRGLDSYLGPLVSLGMAAASKGVIDVDLDYSVNGAFFDVDNYGLPTLVSDSANLRDGLFLPSKFSIDKPNNVLISSVRTDSWIAGILNVRTRNATVYYRPRVAPYDVASQSNVTYYANVFMQAGFDGSRHSIILNADSSVKSYTCHANRRSGQTIPQMVKWDLNEFPLMVDSNDIFVTAASPTFPWDSDGMMASTYAWPELGYEYVIHSGTQTIDVYGVINGSDVLLGSVVNGYYTPSDNASALGYVASPIVSPSSVSPGTFSDYLINDDLGNEFPFGDFSLRSFEDWWSSISEHGYEGGMLQGLFSYWSISYLKAIFTTLYQDVLPILNTALTPLNDGLQSISDYLDTISGQLLGISVLMPDNSLITTRLDEILLAIPSFDSDGDLSIEVYDDTALLASLAQTYSLLNAQAGVVASINSNIDDLVELVAQINGNLVGTPDDLDDLPDAIEDFADTLSSRFPFSLITTLFGILSFFVAVQPVAPYISIPMDVDGVNTLDLDFAVFDPVFSVFRIIVILSFVVFLAFASRRFIFVGGGNE